MGLTGKVDNPYQRISDDLGSFVEATETFTIKLVFAIGGVVTYFAIIWSISSAMALFLIAYATVGTYFAAVIGRRLVGLNYYQERFQADFRFGLYTCATTSSRFSFTAANAMRLISCTTALRRWSAISGS